MTALEQSTERLIAAAQGDDLRGLDEALTARAAAIAELADAAPAAEVAAGLAAALETGEIARRALHALQLRIRFESGQLVRIEALVHNLLVAPAPEIDYRG